MGRETRGEGLGCPVVVLTGIIAGEFPAGFLGEDAEVGFQEGGGGGFEHARDEGGQQLRVAGSRSGKVLNYSAPE